MTHRERPSVSAVVCAYTEDRWDDTVAAVESLFGQDRPPDEVVLVIDHNPALSARARERFASTPRIHVVDNAFAAGLSGGRNTALRVVTGDVVAFLDDDAEARPDWIAILLPHYDDPSVAAVGGRAEPRWPADGPPACLPPELLWVVGCSYAGQHVAAAAGPVRNLMGCAMSFRREAVAAIGGFSTSLGRVGNTPLGGEETDLCIRLRQARPEAVVLFDPRAVVDHRVTPARTRWSYLARRCWSEGISKAALARRVGSGDGLAAERGYTRSILPAAWWRELRSAAATFVRGRVPTMLRRLGAACALVVSVLTAGAGYVRGRVASRPGETTLRAAALANRRWAAGLLAVAGVVASVQAVLDISAGTAGVVRAATTVVFLLLGPGWAIAGFMRRVSPALLWTVAAALGCALGALTGQAMVLLRIWNPVAAFYLVAALAVPALLRHAIRTR